MAKIITEREGGGMRVQYVSNQPSLTEQSHKERVNINNIMRKARQTGMMPLNTQSPMFADVSQINSFQECLDFINEAKYDFMKLPAEIRKEFGNDPARMIDFLNDPENRTQALELGLLKEETPAPQEEQKTPPEPAEGSTIEAS